MGIMVYSLLWVVQDFVHQPYEALYSAVDCITNPIRPEKALYTTLTLV